MNTGDKVKFEFKEAGEFGAYVWFWKPDASKTTRIEGFLNKKEVSKIKPGVVYAGQITKMSREKGSYDISRKVR